MRAVFLLLTGLLLMTASVTHANADDRILNIQDYKTLSGLSFWHVEDHSLPIMTMHFAFDNSGSIHDPMDKTGLGQLVSNTMDEGAGERDADMYQEALQNHAIDLTFPIIVTISREK